MQPSSLVRNFQPVKLNESLVADWTLQLKISLVAQTQASELIFELARATLLEDGALLAQRPLNHNQLFLEQLFVDFPTFLASSTWRDAI